MKHQKPILYSFRRCPYAMRARLAIAYAGIEYEHREIELKNKPSGMLEASPKGTVPVLVLGNGEVIDESLDIMHWVLEQNDPDNLLEKTSFELISYNDQEFKPQLDRYKYPTRYPDEDCTGARDKCEMFFQMLDERISGRGRLGGITDYAIFPFIRQCANVDRKWFDGLVYKGMQGWLDSNLESDIFSTIMKKYDLWSV